MNEKLTAKQYLKQAYRLNEHIESLIAELRLMRETMDGLSAVNYDRDKIQSNNTASPVEVTVQKIIMMQDRINTEIDEYVDMKREIHEEINKVSDPDERLVLRARYILFKSWDDIQAMIGKKETRAYIIHRTALAHFVVPDSRFAYKKNIEAVQ